MITDARFVHLGDGRRILQLQRQLWGGEAHEWFTPKTVELIELSDEERDEIGTVLGDTL